MNLTHRSTDDLIHLTKQNFFSTSLFSFVLFAIPAFTLSTSFGLGLAECIILLGALYYAKPLWQQSLYLFNATQFVVFAFIFNFAVAACSLLWFGFEAKFLNNPLRQLVVVTAIGLIVLTRPNAKLFWYGLFAGTASAAILSLYQRIALDMVRAQGFHMPITFGDIAIAMGLMSLASIQYFAKSRLAILPYLSFFAGLTASLLSGSRGGWVALLFSFIPLYSYGQSKVKKGALISATLTCLLLIAAYFTPQSNIRQRFLDIYNDIAQYQAGQVFTSIGTRLEMWKGAWKIFLDHPLFGAGRANFHNGINQLIARGELHPSISDFHHAHNEILHALATQGLLGASALIFLYAAPAAFFIRYLHKNDASHPYALAGLLLVVSFIDFGLTQVLFAHHIGAAFYATTICALSGVCIMSNHPHTNPNHAEKPDQ